MWTHLWRIKRKGSREREGRLSDCNACLPACDGRERKEEWGWNASVCKAAPRRLSQAKGEPRAKPAHWRKLHRAGTVTVLSLAGSIWGEWDLRMNAVMDPKDLTAGGCPFIILLRASASLRGVLSGALLWLPHHFISTYHTGCHLPSLLCSHSKCRGSLGNHFLPISYIFLTRCHLNSQFQILPSLNVNANSVC